MTNLPKVLVIDISAWRKDATAHTLMSIFSCWQPEQLALLYTRTDMPDTKMCSRIFQISEGAVLRSVLKPWTRTGQEIFPRMEADSALLHAEQVRYQRAHKKRSKIMPILREIVWILGHWKSKELKQYIKSVNPDILFIPIFPVIYMGRIQRYIMKLTNKPIVCYLADDNYSYISCSDIFSYVHRFFLRRQVRYLAKHCKEMFVIVDKEKEDTDCLFGTDSVILTKGIDFSRVNYSSPQLNYPIKFVYTGRLIIGRDKTLALLADVINEVNTNGIKATLEIYSGDEVKEEIASRINRGACRHCGYVTRECINEIQRNADVVVFAESIEGKDANIARLSFSTKITDYLSSGKCILAIGKEDIAPIDYFNRNDSALIASTPEQIAQRVQEIVSNPNLVMEYSVKAFECAKRNHDKKIIDARFIEVMKKAMNK